MNHARTLLLVDDEEHILASLKRMLRRDGYTIVTAGSGLAGLAVLAETPVDVIVSDQRMPGMSGVEFLRLAKASYPGTVRMVLSGYTDLQSVTDAINEGAIYKFLTKPWDDDLLRADIAEAFRQKMLEDENLRLHSELASAHQDLIQAHEKLREMLHDQSRRLAQDQVLMGVAHEVLDRLPVSVVGCDEDGLIVLINAEALRVFPQAQPGICLSEVADLAPAASLLKAPDGAASLCLDVRNQSWVVRFSALGQRSQSRGGVLTFLPRDPCAMTQPQPHANNPAPTHEHHHP